MNCVVPKKRCETEFPDADGMLVGLSVDASSTKMSVRWHCDAFSDAVQAGNVVGLGE